MCDRPEHKHHKERAAEIELGDQLSQSEQGRGPELADGKRDGAECADWRYDHHIADHLEKNLRRGSNRLDDRRCFCADGRKREGKKDGDEQYRKDIAVRECADGAGWNDVEQKFAKIGMLRRGFDGGHAFVRQARRIDVHVRAGSPGIDENQRNDERQSGDDLEIDQSFEGDAAYALCFAHTGNTMNHRAEDDRRHQHPHQLDEKIAQRFQRIRARWPDKADKDSQRHGDEYLHRKVAIDRAATSSREIRGVGCHGAFRNDRTEALKRSLASSCTRWPMPSNTSTFAFLILVASSRASFTLSTMR